MSGWEQLGAIIAVLTPLVGAPLTALTVYLKNIRQQHAEKIAELALKAERLTEVTATLTWRLNDLLRDTATKEEWVRESMLARSERKWLTEAVVRLQSEVQTLGVRQVQREPCRANEFEHDPDVQGDN